MFMKETHILLTTFVIGVVLIESSFAIQCWDCNSYENKNCADPFVNHTISLVNCNQFEISNNRKTQQCSKTIQRDGKGTTKIIRGCRDDEPSSHDGHGADIELCNFDGCNSARNHVPFILMIFATPVVVGICNIVFSSSTRIKTN